MRTILFVMLMSTVAMSCKKKETTGGADKAAEGAALLRPPICLR